MFSGKVEAHPCPEFKNKLPNLYLELMQYNNPNGKWLEDIPYIMINLEHDRDIYLGKDTIITYAQEEDRTCKYLEINEIIEPTDFKKGISTKGKSIIESDLVFYLAQVTEHHCVELMDQEISQQTRERFEKLKRKYPKFFWVHSQDIGRTNLVTMHVIQVNIPQYARNCTLYLSSITAGFNRRLKHLSMWETSRRASALGPAQ